MKTPTELYNESLAEIEKIDVLNEVSLKIREITDALYSKDLSNWTGDQISRAITSLAVLRVNLGVEVANSVAFYDMSYLSRKVKYANEWKPTKDALNQRLQKATNADIDSEIMQKLESDIEEELKGKHYSGQVRILYDSTETLITALQSRLGIIRAERYESRHQT